MNNSVRNWVPNRAGRATGATRGYPGVRAELDAGFTVAFVIAGCTVVLAAECTVAYGTTGCVVVLATGSLVAYGTTEYVIVFAGES